MRIHFDSVEREARILSPLAEFRTVTQKLEHRKDPLTGHSVIVSKQRMDYVKRFIQSDSRFIDEFVRSTEANCPFCPDAVEKNAPKFPPEISLEGRIKVGDAICFPSLFAHQDFNALVVPTRQHRLQLNEFSTALLLNAFKACITYFRRVYSTSPSARNAAIVMNFLPPAGSTIAHPHVQALMSDIPTQAMTKLLEASQSYATKNGTDYWRDLVETEKTLNVRYIADLNGVHWLTPFAPLGLNDAEGIVCGKSSFDGLSEVELSGLADGISRVLKYYHDTDVRSFNATVYSAPLGKSTDYFSLSTRIVSRYGYKPNFVSDVWALQYLLGEQEVYESPEETSVKLRKYFQ
jgi:UDPglucose--hexose-1-phosphate uridylyltransferase